MNITLRATLEQILHNCNDWEVFCREEGWSEWAVNEGGGDTEVVLSWEKAKKYGLIPKVDDE